MKKSNYLKVVISLGSLLGMAQAVYAGTNTISEPNSQPTSAAPAMGSSWTTQAPKPVPGMNTVMHTAPAAVNTPPVPSKVAGPAGSVTFQTNIMCGDQDVVNFAAGVNPSAPSVSSNVQFLDAKNNPVIDLVLGYWVTLASNVAGGGNSAVPGAAAGYATWYPLAYDHMSVAPSTTSPQPKIDTMNAISKTSGTGSGMDLGNLIFNKASSVLGSLGSGSYAMGAGNNKYAVYFGLMACNAFDNKVGTTANKDEPDSLEIADFLYNLPAAVANQNLSCSPGSCVIGYSAPTANSTPSSSGAPSLVLGGSGGGFNVSLSSNNAPLYGLGKAVASNPYSGLSASSAGQLDGVAGHMADPDCTKVLGEGNQPRWFEPFAMNVTCKVLNTVSGYSNFQAAYAAYKGGTDTAAGPALSATLMQAGIAQGAQNTLAALTPPTARCFTPGQEYIDKVLASVTFPFTVSNGTLVALAPGKMTHPEALFADINYASNYCTRTGTTPACKGSDFDTVFGMTANPVATVLAKNSSNVYEEVSDLFVPKANAMALMLEGGADVVTSKSTYELGIGMIKSGVPVTTAVYTGSLVGSPDQQASANALDGIPITSGMAQTVSTPLKELTFIPNGLGLIINVRANGSGSGCPVTYCKADGQTADSLFE